MSEDTSTLLGIAEIAGVFVGFAALVTIVARGVERESRFDDADRLLNVVIVSAEAMAAALLPIVLDRYGISQPVIWRVSSGLVFAANWGVILFLNRVTQGFASVHSRMRGLSIAIWILEMFYQALLLLCILGAWQSQAPAFYLTAIVVGLFQVILIMVDLVASLIAGQRA